MEYGIVLEGEAAVVERQRLLEDGREVPLVVRVRDSRGRKKTTWLRLGMCSSTAWVYWREEAEGCMTKQFLEMVLAHKASAFFLNQVERLQLRGCLVDPSPTSAQFVEISPDLGDVVTDLRNAFGVELNTWW